MEWNLCSSTPWASFYPYIRFHNPMPYPMPKPCCQKSRKTIITQNVLVRQSSNIVHCDQHTQKPICADLQAFSHTFSLLKLTFVFIFCLTEGQPDPKAPQVSSWPDVILLFATRCLYWGMSHWRSAWPKGWPNVKMTWCSTILGHQMPLLGVYLTEG